MAQFGIPSFCGGTATATTALLLEVLSEIVSPAGGSPVDIDIDIEFRRSGK